MQCSKCLKDNLSALDFDTTHKGYQYSYCKECRRNQVNSARRIRYRKPENKLKKKLKTQSFRQNPEKRANVIAKDSKSSDKKHGREFNLTIERIRELIENTCQYCGENKLQMTLDRIDNSIGHIESNVVPACIRCNLIRRHIPYEAWLCMLPGIREAREKGLFEGWVIKTWTSRRKS